jgi:hypothetical protein
MRASLAMAVLLFGGCASAPRIVLEPQVATMPRDPLDIRFSQVDMNRVPVLTAAEALSSEIRKAYGERFAPDVAYTAGPFPAVPERPVTVHAKNVSFRQLMDEFCRQTGWRYRVNGLGWIEFESGPVPGYQPEIRRPRPNQALQPTASRCTSISFMIKTVPEIFTRAPGSRG